MAGEIKIALQRIIHKFGYHVIRRDSNVRIDDAFNEQIRLIGPNAGCVVEVGAADGRDTERYATAFPHAQVFAFEPLKESFDILDGRTRKFPTITSVNAAVADVGGISNFYVGTWPDASSLLHAQPLGSNYDVYAAPTHSVQVDVVTLDEYCRDHGIWKIDLLKMDAQGAELKILTGARELLDRGAIRLIYSEIHFAEGYAGSGLFHDVSRFLHEHGFSLHGLYDLVRDHRGRTLWGDAIFYHRENFKSEL